MMTDPRLRRNLLLGVVGGFVVAAAREAFRGHFAQAHKRLMLSSAVFLAPTLMKNASWCGHVINHFPTDRREVLLTLDDGPDPIHTPEILDVLKERQARAIFFAIGRRVQCAPELARRIVEEGHLLQNHTYSHSARTFWATGPRRARREISECSRAIFDATGTRPVLFRAPVGFANPFLHAAIENAQMQMIGWSLSGNDGISHRPEEVLDRILSHLHPGAIILLHEHQLSSMQPGARAETLAALLDGLHRKSYRTVVPAITNPNIKG